jgi:sugar lactone lactonase YvrE
MRRVLLCAVAVAALGWGCDRADKAPTRVRAMGGFRTPESVKWDPAQDVYLVSNVNGNPGEKDNNGFISRVTPAGSVDNGFIVGGRNGITLNAPKGLALLGDTLWVADIDEVRAFHAATGAPLASVAIAGAVFLNDIAAAPDGSLYVSDTGIKFGAGGMEHPGPDRVFRVARDRQVSVVMEGHMLSGPNGVTWDRENDRLIIAPFAGSSLLSWKTGDQGPTVIGTGPGQFDGVEIVNDEIWVSSWADSSVSRYEDGEGTNLIKGVASPADIGYDAKRKRILIPLFTGDQVEVWQLP